MKIGKIIKSNSHLDYICQVYGPNELESPLARDEYAFGTFVRVAPAQNPARLPPPALGFVALDEPFSPKSGPVVRLAS